MIQEKDGSVSLEKGSGKLPWFCGNKEQVITIYGEQENNQYQSILLKSYIGIKYYSLHNDVRNSYEMALIISLDHIVSIGSYCL